MSLVVVRNTAEADHYLNSFNQIMAEMAEIQGNLEYELALGRRIVFLNALRLRILMNLILMSRSCYLCRLFP